jgi:hypothetical protein
MCILGCLCILAMCRYVTKYVSAINGINKMELENGQVLHTITPKRNKNKEEENKSRQVLFEKYKNNSSLKFVLSVFDFLPGDLQDKLADLTKNTNLEVEPDVLQYLSQFNRNDLTTFKPDHLESLHRAITRNMSKPIDSFRQKVREYRFQTVHPILQRLTAELTKLRCICFLGEQNTKHFHTKEEDDFAITIHVKHLSLETEEEKEASEWYFVEAQKVVLSYLQELSKTFECESYKCDDVPLKTYMTKEDGNEVITLWLHLHSDVVFFYEEHPPVHLVKYVPIAYFIFQDEYQKHPENKTFFYAEQGGYTQIYVLPL